MKSRSKMRQRQARKNYDQESILSRLQGEGAFPFVVVLDHLKAGFNVGKILRSAHALGAREVHLVGIPSFDPGPAKGSFRKTRTRMFATLDESLALLRQDGYAIFALDPAGEATLGKDALPERTAFILGHEEFGLSFDPSSSPEIRGLRIPQFGVVESLNVSVAASLAMFEYVRQRGFEPPRDWSPAPPDARLSMPPAPAPREVPLP